MALTVGALATDEIFWSDGDSYLSTVIKSALHRRSQGGRRVAYIDTTADLPGMIEAIEMTPSSEANFTSYYQAALGWDGRDPVRARKVPVLPPAGAGSGAGGCSRPTESPAN